MEQWWNDLLTFLSYENLNAWLQQYANLGPLPGILLPLLEAVLPVLPLMAIVIGNAAAYGLWEGFLWSWIGAVLGSSLVFYLARAFGHRFAERLEARSEKMHRFMEWVSAKGFTPVFVISCIPFAPSSLVNVVSGMSDLPFKTFFLAILLGKSVMLFIVSFIGHDLGAFYEDPWKLLLVAAAIGVLWWLGKIVGRWAEKGQANQ